MAVTVFIVFYSFTVQIFAMVVVNYSIILTMDQEEGAVDVPNPTDRVEPFFDKTFRSPTDVLSYILDA